MNVGRTLLVALDGLDNADLAALRDMPLAPREHALLECLFERMALLRIGPSGPSENAPALTKLVTGASVAANGIATEVPFDVGAAPGAWYARNVLVPTLFDQARQAGLVTAALQWPATAGADIDLCLPLIEDLRRYRDRWTMAEETSSERMVAEHLRPRRDAGVQLSHVPADALVTEVAIEALETNRIDLLAIRLTGLATARRADAPGSATVQRARADALGELMRILAAFNPSAADRVMLVPGRPLVPTTLLVHPNAALAEAGLVSIDGPRLADYRAIVWPDGPHGALHVRRNESAELREHAIAVLAELTELPDGARLQLRRVEDGIGATVDTDVVAVLDGAPGVLFGESATHRPLVRGDDPYYAGPRAVTDPTACVDVLAAGPGLPRRSIGGSWAQLGVSLAASMGLTLPGATTTALAA